MMKDEFKHPTLAITIGLGSKSEQRWNRYRRSAGPVRFGTGTDSRPAGLSDLISCHYHIDLLKTSSF